MTATQNNFEQIRLLLKRVPVDVQCKNEICGYWGDLVTVFNFGQCCDVSEKSLLCGHRDYTLAQLSLNMRGRLFSQMCAQAGVNYGKYMESSVPAEINQGLSYEDVLSLRRSFHLENMVQARRFVHKIYPEIMEESTDGLTKKGAQYFSKGEGVEVANTIYNGHAEILLLVMNGSSLGLHYQCFLEAQHHQVADFVHEDLCKLNKEMQKVDSPVSGCVSEMLNYLALRTSRNARIRPILLGALFSDIPFVMPAVLSKGLSTTNHTSPEEYARTVTLGTVLTLRNWLNTDAPMQCANSFDNVRSSKTDSWLNSLINSANNTAQMLTTAVSKLPVVYQKTKKPLYPPPIQVH